METTTIFNLLVIAAATGLIIKMVQELFKSLLVIVIVVMGAVGLYVFNGGKVQAGEKNLNSLDNLDLKKDKPNPNGDLFLTVKNLPSEGTKEAINNNETAEMKRSAPFLIDKRNLRPIPPAKLRVHQNYNLQERINMVTKFKAPSYTLAGAYASTFKQAVDKAAYLRDQGFDHLFIIYLPDYAVEDAEGWPYAITVTGPLGKLESIKAAYEHFFYLEQVKNQVSEKMDVLQLAGYREQM